MRRTSESGEVLVMSVSELQADPNPPDTKKATLTGGFRL